MPGYTHLQRGQPVTLGHHLLAWVEMLDRDRSRFAAAREAAAAEPARGGRPRRARRSASTRRTVRCANSIDAVADRDFALDYLYAAADAPPAPLADGRGDRPLGDLRVRLREAPRERVDGLVDDAPEAQPGRRRARARQGGDGDRPARPACSRRSRGCRSRTTATCRRTRRPSSPRARDVRLALQGDDGARQRARGEPRPAGRGGRRSAPARDGRRRGARQGGVPFREAHEQVAASVRDGSYRPVGSAAESVARGPSPGPGDVAAAIATRDASRPTAVRRPIRRVRVTSRRRRRRTAGATLDTGGASTDEAHRTRRRPRARRRRPRRRPAARGRPGRRPRRDGGDTVTVTGTGSVDRRARPRGQISAGVESRAPTARAALAANAAAMRKVLDALRARGGKDVTTQIGLALDGVRPNGRAGRVRRLERRLGGDDPRRRRAR